LRRPPALPHYRVMNGFACLLSQMTVVSLWFVMPIAAIIEGDTFLSTCCIAQLTLWPYSLPDHAQPNRVSGSIEGTPYRRMRSCSLFCHTRPRGSRSAAGRWRGYTFFIEPPLIKYTFLLLLSMKSRKKYFDTYIDRGLSQDYNAANEHFKRSSIFILVMLVCICTGLRGSTMQTIRSQRKQQSITSNYYRLFMDLYKYLGISS